MATFAGVLALAACSKSSRSASPLAGKGKDYWLDWNLKTLVDAYQNAGHTSTKWDASAKRALTEFARIRTSSMHTNEDANTIISVSVDSATQAGCDDPMIHYLYIRFVMDQAKSKEEFSAAFCDTARQMNISSYPEIRKFYAAQRALDQLIYTYGTNVGAQPDWNDMSSMVIGHLQATLADKEMPAEEAYEACMAAIDRYQYGEKGLTQRYDIIEKPLFESWPKAATTWLFKGHVYIQLAWIARGGGGANQVGEDAFKTFFDRLGVAENALSNAWHLDPTDGRIPTEMITVDEGLQRKRDEMEMWFSRAMACNPDNYDACSHKLHYLYPQWYGSREEMLAFGRQCVAATNWGGSVPLILVDAHNDFQSFLPDENDRARYWKYPDVWPDIKSAYDRYFELNPDATALYNNYALYAYYCRQWQAFLDLVPKLDPVNYNLFGGQDEFDKLVAYAKSQNTSR